jgi:glycosyltransferase involved in cell wall biosynthesis
MFAGCSIVASDVGEVAVALANGEAGVLVRPADPAALADAIDTMLSDPLRSREFGQCAARRAAAEYDVSRMIGRYVDVYENLLDRSRASIDLPRRQAS